jgi:hypothetical protein
MRTESNQKMGLSMNNSYGLLYYIGFETCHISLCMHNWWILSQSITVEQFYWCISYLGFEVLAAVVMNVATFWDIVACSPHVNRYFLATCYSWFLSLLIFNPEDGGDTFLRNVSSHTDYTASTREPMFPSHLLQSGFFLCWFSTLKMEVTLFSETLFHIQTTLRYIPEDGNIHSFIHSFIHYLIIFSLLH